MKKTLIIAEAGVNHNGRIDLAMEMVRVAKDCGADIVKFQTAVPEEVMIPNAPKAAYQINEGAENESQLEMAKKIHLPLDAFPRIKSYCEELGIGFLTTAFDPISLDYVCRLNLDYFKIPSGEITNFPYLREIAKQQKRVILSTGISALGEIEDAIEVLTRFGTKREDITLLHCTTEYPAPYSEVNLNAMLTLQEAFKLDVGLSDHTMGIEISLAATALGASVIEKHFTLDKTMEGPDHLASLEPNELKTLIKSIRNIDIAFGDGIKRGGHSETKNKVIVRKSIVAKEKISFGQTFSEDNLTTKRPGSGLSPMMWETMIGRIADKEYDKDDLIQF